MTLREALRRRRSYYDLSSASAVSDETIKEIIDFALLNTPSAFNSQSARLVLLLGAEHAALWDMIKASLRAIVPAEAFDPTERKMASFAAGHGSILFFEDQETIAGLQREVPLYKDDFPVYSMHSTGMIQFAVWMLLREAGIGASLQHYGNLVEKEVKERWKLPASWRFIAQMPFGVPNSEPGAKEYLPLEGRSLMFS